jgi:hypothetical protein
MEICEVCWIGLGCFVAGFVVCLALFSAMERDDHTQGFKVYKNKIYRLVETRLTE